MLISTAFSVEGPTHASNRPHHNAARPFSESHQALARVTSGPGRVLAGACSQAAQAGQLSIGAPADLCVVDPNAFWQVTREALLSQSQHTPFLGIELPGRVCLTVVRGQIAWELAG